jgi:antitoxin FitA
MASITIRRLEESTKERLRRRAARNGRSMEEEAREIFRLALAKKAAVHSEPNLAESIRRIFAPLGGVELPVIPREPIREPPDFSK